MGEGRAAAHCSTHHIHIQPKTKQDSYKFIHIANVERGGEARGILPGNNTYGECMEPLN